MADVGKRLGQASELTVIVPIKAGQGDALRQTLADPALDAPNMFAAVPMIHYARWTILAPGGAGGATSLLLFSSNYDGAFEDYMAALAEAVTDKLDRIWSHCEDWTGAASAAELTGFITAHAQKAALFYSAYPDVTVGEVRRALKMQQALQNLFDALQE